MSSSFSLIINKRINSFNKTIVVDPDKSISIRSFLIGAISHNISKAKNVLESEDVISTIRCLKKLGVKIVKKKSKNYLVYGKGLASLSAKKNLVLNFGNSGTLARLLIGILSTTPKIDVKIEGDRSLNKRNMKKLIELMSKYGAFFFPKNKTTLPLKLVSSEMPIGIKYLAGNSAQLKSAVMLAHNSQAIKINNKKNKIIKVFGRKHLNPIDVDIPGDPSSAAFFSALTLLNKNSTLKIKNVGLNATRVGFYKLLKKHGAKILFKNIKKNKFDIKGDILVKSSKVRPIKASEKYYVNATDEYPIMFVIAALLKGVSIFKGIGELSNKESNRIKEMQKILKQVGVKSIATKNELKIFGKGMLDATNKKIYVSNLGDHRICMSAFILSVLTGARAQIKSFETVYTSSPSYLKIMKKLGAKFEKKK